MLLIVSVDVRNDWLDYLALLVGGLTAAAALWGLWLASKDAKHANVDRQKAQDELKALRGELEPADRLLRAEAELAYAQSVLGSFNSRGDTPAASERATARLQRDITLLPAGRFPHIQAGVDSYMPELGREIKAEQPKFVAGDDVSWTGELEAFIAEQALLVERLRKDPQATGGVIEPL